MVKKLTICSKCIATGADTTGYKARPMRPTKLRCEKCQRMGWCTVYAKEPPEEAEA